MKWVFFILGLNYVVNVVNGAEEERMNTVKEKIAEIEVMMDALNGNGSTHEPSNSPQQFSHIAQQQRDFVSTEFHEDIIAHEEYKRFVITNGQPRDFSIRNVNPFAPFADQPMITIYPTETQVDWSLYILVPDEFYIQTRFPVILSITIDNIENREFNMAEHIPQLEPLTIKFSVTEDTITMNDFNEFRRADFYKTVKFGNHKYKHLIFLNIRVVSDFVTHMIFCKYCLCVESIPFEQHASVTDFKDHYDVFNAINTSFIVLSVVVAIIVTIPLVHYCIKSRFYKRMFTRNMPKDFMEDMKKRVIRIEELQKNARERRLYNSSRFEPKQNVHVERIVRSNFSENDTNGGIQNKRKIRKGLEAEDVFDALQSSKIGSTLSKRKTLATLPNEDSAVELKTPAKSKQSLAIDKTQMGHLMDKTQFSSDVHPESTQVKEMSLSITQKSGVTSNFLDNVNDIPEFSSKENSLKPSKIGSVQEKTSILPKSIQTTITKAPESLRATKDVDSKSVYTTAGKFLEPVKVSTASDYSDPESTARAESPRANKRKESLEDFNHTSMHNSGVETDKKDQGSSESK